MVTDVCKHQDITIVYLIDHIVTVKSDTVPFRLPFTKTLTPNNGVLDALSVILPLTVCWAKKIKGKNRNTPIKVLFNLFILFI